MSEHTDADRLAMLEARVVELERQLASYLGRTQGYSSAAPARGYYINSGGIHQFVRFDDE